MRVIAPVLMFASLCAAQSTGSVEGVVVDRVTGAGIPEASVTFYIRTQQGAIYEAKTDASGDFSIFGMKPGGYEVRFEKDGYRSGNKIPPQPYAVGQRNEPIRIRLEMTRLVSLSGRVIDPDGNPMSQGEVKLVNRNSVPVATDGSFTMKDLEPGSYTLAAIPKATQVPEGARVPVVTYSPEPVVIRGDVDVSGYEIRLQTAEVYRVSGVVLDETGNPKPNVAIQLLPKIQSGPRAVLQGSFMTFVGPGPSVGPEEARVTSVADGSFEFPQVRSGDWQLAGVSSGPIDSVDAIKNFHSGALEVVVADRSVGNLQIRQFPSFQISGTIDWGDVTPSQRTGIGLQPADGRTAFPGPSSFRPDGTLSFSASPGRYLILPQAGPGYFPISVQLNGQEVSGKPVDLYPTSTIHVSYKAAKGSVRGTVENCSGGVLLIPKDIQTLAFGRVADCKTDGSFEAAGIPPGDYSAIAFPTAINLMDFRDPGFLAKAISAGTSVFVQQSSVTVQLKVIRLPE